MAAPISGIGVIRPPDPIRIGPAGGSGGEFRSLFESAVQRVEGFQSNAAQSVERYISGEGEEVHEAALATQRAELALDLFVQARNKVVSAYQEIMRMQM
jgi:flagellar hook-basal body complex protein FliE